MKVLVSILPLSLTVSIACLVGCSAEHVTAVDDSHALVSDSAPVPGDQWGICDERNWECSDPDGGCIGWYEREECGAADEKECEIDRYLVGCYHDCQIDAHCPVPLSGDAAPVCVDQKCYLSCDDGRTCPNGHSCVAGPLFTSAGEYPNPPLVCTQVFSAEEFWQYDD